MSVACLKKARHSALQSLEKSEASDSDSFIRVFSGLRPRFDLVERRNDDHRRPSLSFRETTTSIQVDTIRLLIFR
jgi:hypothetical protein